MGRGRGQQNPAFVPRPRDTPPQYGGHQAAQQFVKPVIYFIVSDRNLFLF